MSEQSPSHPPLLKRLIVLAARLYLLFMVVYLVGRFIVQDGFWLLSLLNTFALLLFLPLPVLLILALAVRSRLALLNVLPVIALALLWFAPRYLPKSIALPEPPIIRVMTHNVWHSNPTPGAVSDLVLMASPDVVFLQEFETSAQLDGLTPLRAEYPYETNLEDTQRLDMYTASNITLSRFPFVESEQIALDTANMPSIYRNVIEIDGRRIALYNVHLVSPSNGRSRLNAGGNYIARYTFSFDDRERNQQIDALLAHLSTEPYPYIVAGDFNTGDLSMTYQRLRGQMADSFSAAGFGLGASWPVVDALGWPSFIPPLVRMDYIWHSSGLRTVSAWQGHFVGSDHLPILADLVFDS
jgi:vancomycin resistance protein VanJ